MSPVLQQLVSLVVPPSCLACRAPLGSGTDLCGPCRRRLRWLRDVCPRCGLPAPCGRTCPAARSAVDRAWAPLVHEGPARRLVVAFKHHGRLPLAGAMAAHMVASAPRDLMADGVVLVPVPADAWRRRRRGFDHTLPLARAVSARSGLPVQRQLSRAPGVAAQVGRGRSGRLQAGAVAGVRSRPQSPVRALLIDDVHTTGATLDACARALRAEGSRRVDALTYTRALR
jgi:predicted amidophosphoribosyltransferase